jgi:hypothetical protein
MRREFARKALAPHRDCRATIGPRHGVKELLRRRVCLFKMIDPRGHAISSEMASLSGLHFSVQSPLVPVGAAEYRAICQPSTSTRSEVLRCERCPSEEPMAPTFRLALITVAATLAYLGLSRSHYDLSVSAETAPLDMHSGAGIGSSRRRSNR